MGLQVYVDGKYYDELDAKISVFDHGVLYGDGAFEGIRAYNGRVFELEKHIDRFFYAMKALMIDLGMTKQEVQNVVLESIRVNKQTDCYIRLYVTRGYGDLGIDPRKCKKPSLVCIPAQIAVYPKELYETGLNIITASQRRNKATILDPQIKSLNYVNNILAKLEANRAGVSECIMLNEDGIVAECTADNIFIVKDEVIFTPPTYVGILDGITRKTVIKLAKELGYEVRETEFTLFNVYNADECFLTGTGAEAIAINNVDGRAIGTGVCGPITRKLLDAYSAYVRSHGTPIYE